MFQVLKNILCFFAMLCFFFSLNAIALSTDSQSKVNVVADSATFNYKTGVKIFQGHVKIDQGTTHITADRVITKNNNQSRIAEAIAYGTPTELAHYWTTPKVGDPDIHARANVIKYYPIDSNVVLQDKVIVTQGENSFQGQLILYNMHDETITVPASQNGRAVLVYNPE